MAVQTRLAPDGDVGLVEIDGTAVGPGTGPEELAGRLRRAADELVARGVTSVVLATDHPLDRDDPLLARATADAGFDRHRDLFQLRRSLPLTADDPVRGGRPELATRAFRPGTDDEDAWVAVNNRAFAGHPDQGHETLASLHARMAEPWFDAADFLVVDAPGDGLAGFCWTKVHPPTGDDPALGEIYVIGVDPDQQGTGLGRDLALAGFDHLAGRGLTVGMLYVDEGNAPARALYAKLGFRPHHRRRVSTRSRDARPTTPQPGVG